MRLQNDRTLIVTLIRSKVWANNKATKRITADCGTSCDGCRTEPAGGRPTEARFVREPGPWRNIAELPLGGAPGRAAAGPAANWFGPMYAAEGCMSHGGASGGADNSLRRSWLARSRPLTSICRCCATSRCLQKQACNQSEAKCAKFSEQKWIYNLKQTKCRM